MLFRLYDKDTDKRAALTLWRMMQKLYFFCLAIIVFAITPSLGFKAVPFLNDAMARVAIPVYWWDWPLDFGGFLAVKYGLLGFYLIAFATGGYFVYRGATAK